MKKKLNKKVLLGYFYYKFDYIEKIISKYTELTVNDNDFVLQSNEKILVSKIKKRTISSLQKGDIILLDDKEYKIKSIKHTENEIDFYNIKKLGKFNGVGCYKNTIPDFYISSLDTETHIFEDFFGLSIKDIYLTI